MSGEFDVNLLFDLRGGLFFGKIAKQIPFAMSKAINATMVGAREAVIDRMDSIFTLRPNKEKSWSARSLSFKAAKKKDLSGTLGFTAGYMTLHETGGKKTNKAGGMVAIPLAARKNKMAKITPKKFPKKLLAKPNYMPGKTAKGVPAVMQKFNGKKTPPKVHYILKKSIKIKKRLEFKQTVSDYAAKHWPEHAREALDFAVKTAK